MLRTFLIPLFGVGRGPVMPTRSKGEVVLSFSPSCFPIGLNLLSKSSYLYRATLEVATIKS